jgi:hypothetical protein
VKGQHPAIMEKQDNTEAMHIENGINQKLGSLDAHDLQAELASLDHELQVKLRKKFDKWILPVVTLVYLMAFIDRWVRAFLSCNTRRNYSRICRSNMGNAKIMGMEEDLNLQGFDFNIALTGFFITYILFEV